jgi:hypothetical protein
MYHYTAIVICVAVALHFFFALQVARARAVYGVKLPAITGNPDFERILPHPDEHAGMSADLPADALAVRNLYRRRRGRYRRRGVGYRPHRLLPRLSRGGGQAHPRLRHPGAGLHRVVDRRARRRPVAAGALKDQTRNLEIPGSTLRVTSSAGNRFPWR